ncbi:DUF3243 domain-containing protein [Peribacillus deserti]|uniref:DUF3243 domain-containing protein n=1 Tax=Peribacillus deserti TaxID=673318 RepID=A0A2N5M2M8_9BACI|nr:DUF3243 domain-containing protein [Peribacillus deserti]PLT28575.1 DUF3243 domain-containing protein [Peribacillus deserti]
MSQLNGSSNSETEGRVEQKLNNMSQETKDDILSNFDSFKSYLGEKVSKGESLGLGEEQLAKLTQKVAGYLAEHEEPRNREEYLLQQLWKTGNEEERHMLSHMLVKLVQ